MKRHMGLDLARAFGMLAVVLIHASSTFTLQPSRLSLWGVTPALLCNQAARFAVPLFFLLSGLCLGLGRGKLKLPDFWLGRLRRVGLPYLIWTLFYFFWNHRGPAFFPSLGELGGALLWGSADSHLWFIAVLLQLYLLYPLLRLCMDRLEGLTLAVSFLLSLFCTLVIYVPLPLSGWWRPQLWRLFPTWLFYFVLGMAVTPERLEKLTAFAERRALPLALLTLASCLVYAWDAGNSGDPDSIKPQLFLFTPLVFAALLGSRKWLRKLPATERAVAFLSEKSMTVYFSHVFFLGCLRRLPLLMGNALGMLALFAGTVLSSLLFAWLLSLPGAWQRKRQERTR
ncbi:MAG: acyltransferase [Oscillospiraceae bacterium]|nr:acyltransferase [Oscillospiraceae bacterium]